MLTFLNNLKTTLSDFRKKILINKQDNDKIFNATLAKIDKKITPQFSPSFIPIQSFLNDSANNLKLISIIYFLFQTLRRVWCTPEENTDVCTEQELQQVQEQASIVALISFMILSLSQLFWSVYIMNKRKKHLFEQDRATYIKYEKNLMKTQAVACDFFAQLIIPHRFFTVAAIEIFNTKLMSNFIYVMGFLLPSMFLAFFSSAEIQKLFSKYRGFLYIFMFDFIGTVYRIAGLIDFVSITLGFLSDVTKKDITIPPLTLSLIDLNLGLLWSIAILSSYRIPWYLQNRNYIYISVIINKLKDFYLTICLLFLVLSMFKEQKNTSLNLILSVVTSSLALLNTGVKTLIDRLWEIPITNHPTTSTIEEDEQNIDENEEGSPLLNFYLPARN